MVIRIVAVILIFVISSSNKSSKKAPIEVEQKISSQELIASDFNAYERKSFLTNRERKFFNQVISNLNENQHLIAQVRVADIIKPSDKYPPKSREYNSLFRQVSQWHFDYAVLNKENFHIEYVIELDDSTHQRAQRIKRDNTLNAIMKQTGVPLLRVKSYDEYAAKLESLNL